MKKETALWATIVLLVLLNATVLFLMLRRSSHPPGGHPPTPATMISQVLALDDRQEAEYRAMRDQHHAQMQALSRRYDSLLTPYFALISQPHRTGTRDTLEQALSAIQRRKAQITFDHFAALKSICRQDQQDRFPELIPQVLEVMTHGGRPHPEHRR